MTNMFIQTHAMPNMSGARVPQLLLLMAQASRGICRAHVEVERQVLQHTLRPKSPEAAAAVVRRHVVADVAPGDGHPQVGHTCGDATLGQPPTTYPL